MAQMSYSRIPSIPVSEIKQQIFTDGTKEWVTVYFKKTFSTNIIYYNIPIKWTIEQFVNIVKEWIISDFDFDISNRNYTSYSIQIIEMGQTIPGVKSEEAPCIDDDEQITYYDKYIRNNKWPSFYIKFDFIE